MNKRDKNYPDAAESLHDLAERRKELHFVYAVSEILAEGRSMEQTLDKILRILPHAMQYPAHTSARCQLADIDLKTPGFRQDHRSITGPIIVRGDELGKLVIAYDDNAPDDSLKPFLGEEEEMLDGVCRLLAIYFMHLDELKREKIQRTRADQLVQIISHSPAIAFIWELAEGWPVKFVSSNISSLGYKAAQFETGEILYAQIIHPDDLARVELEFKQFLAEGKPSINTEYRLLDKSGEFRHVSDWTSVERDNDGNPHYAHGIILDVTETVRAEDRVRKYLGVTSNIFIILDAHGKVLDCNDHLCEMVEMSKEALIGRNWLDEFIPEEDRNKVKDYFTSLVETKPGEIFRYGNKIVSVGGVKHHINWSFILETDSEGAIISVIGFGSDVTSVVKDKDRINTLTDLLMDNPNPIFRINRDGDILLANVAAQTLQSSLSHQSETQKQGWRKFIMNAAASTADSTLELSVGERSVLFNINPVSSNSHINLYGLDISARKEMDKRLRDIALNLPGAVFEYILNPDGSDQITYMSPGSMDIWELSPETIQADPAPLWAMIHPDDVNAMQESVHESAANLSHWVHEWRLCPKSGVTRWVRGMGTPDRQSNGSTKWTSVIIDITQAKQIEESIAEALHKSILMLSAAVESRDPYTAGHEQRVAKLAVLIGREMGMDQDALISLELASSVHDVGKIKIPSEILSKPGRLSPIEFELIKMHADDGADLLASIDFKWPIADMIRQHHERWNGSGYPKGLAGKDILLEARIIGVADTIEAMASDRPYRPSKGIENAAEEIREGAGVLYDPEVAAACLKLIANGTIKF